MEFEVKKFEKIEEGAHTGVITRVEYKRVRDKFDYTDVFVKLENDIELKYGCPSFISDVSKLGKLLSVFVDLEVGTKLDPELVLLGKQVSFVTVNQKKDDKEFTNIVDNSIKPFVVEESV